MSIRFWASFLWHLVIRDFGNAIRVVAIREWLTGLTHARLETDSLDSGGFVFVKDVAVALDHTAASVPDPFFASLNRNVPLSHLRYEIVPKTVEHGVFTSDFPRRSRESIPERIQEITPERSQDSFAIDS